MALDSTVALVVAVLSPFIVVPFISMAVTYLCYLRISSGFESWCDESGTLSDSFRVRSLRVCTGFGRLYFHEGMSFYDFALFPENREEITANFSSNLILGFLVGAIAVWYFIF